MHNQNDIESTAVVNMFLTFILKQIIVLRRRNFILLLMLLIAFLAMYSPDKTLVLI